MLALSVREALRDAVAAFGPQRTSVDLASPATPEAVYWAIERARRGGGGGHVTVGAPRHHPQPPAPGHPPLRPRSEQHVGADA